MAEAEVVECPYCASKEGEGHPCVPGAQLIGQSLDGRYEVESILGQGGMGMVFRAIQNSISRPVAVKTLHPSLAGTPAFFDRFKREAELASKLRHPNVITIFDFGRAKDGTCFFVMELLEGESLKQLVKAEGPLPLGRALNIIEQAAKGLAHAHAQGCIHRDLKPHNLMLSSLDGEDHVKVLDFGLVKALEAPEEEQQLTSTGQVLGTPQYMPPEQAGGDVCDQRSDLYSLTGVLYFCLTGTSPFGANTVQKALRAAMTQQVPPVSTHRHGAPVPRSVDEFLRRGLAREKEDRYQDADEFLRELKALQASIIQTDLEAKPLHGVAAPTKEPSSAAHSGPDGRTVTGRAKGGGSGATGATGNLKTGEIPKVQVSDEAFGASKGQRPTTPDLPSLRGPAADRDRDRDREPVRPRKRRGNGKLIVGASVAGAVLIIAGAALVKGITAAKQEPAPVVAAPVVAPTEPAKPATPVAAPEVVVRVRTQPAGAAIYEGDVQIGTAPTELKLSRDKVHVVSLKLEGHDAETRTLDLSRLAGDSTDLDVTLTAAAKEPVKTPVKVPKKPEIPVFE